MTSQTWSGCCGSSSPASSTGTLTRSHRRIPLPKVDILIRELFDLILLDMVMPRLGGLDLLKHVRDLGVKAPVLMMTGGGDTQKEAEALIAGAVGYLHKPFNLRDLDHSVVLALGSGPTAPYRR